MMDAKFEMVDAKLAEFKRENKNMMIQSMMFRC